MTTPGSDSGPGGAGHHPHRTWPWAAVAILAAALVIVPPVVYQTYHCFLGWHDVGNYARANYSFFDFGRFVTSSDGADDFFAQQHFEPFFFLLCIPVRLFGTPGYIAAITLALVLAAGYVFAFVPLLFTGPGLLFQASLAFVCVLGGWRYVLACGVMLLWFIYPGGPPRSNFAYYYSYAALAVSFVVLPFALVTLRTACARLATCLEPRRCAAWAVGLAMGAVLAASLAMHLPGYGPEPIRSLIDPHTVFGKGPGVSVRVVRSLIAHYLTADEGSVLAQFYTFCAIPQRRLMYLTLWDRGEFLAGRLKPKFVLLDLNADDPWVPRGDLRAIGDLLRRGDAYRPLYDVDGVLLYQHLAGAGR